MIKQWIHSAVGNKFSHSVIWVDKMLLKWMSWESQDNVLKFHNCKTINMTEGPKLKSKNNKVVIKLYIYIYTYKWG